MTDRRTDATGEHQPEGAAVERASGGGDDSPPADSPEPSHDAPRAFTPLTPFGDAKPWAGSTLDPEGEAHQEPDAADQSEPRTE